MNTPTRVCDDCLQSAAEEALTPIEECELLCTELGGEIADHLCAEIELNGEIRCACACHWSVKQTIRNATARRAS